MTKEKKQEFTLRIAQANQSQLVVILYELFFYYIEEAEQALQNANSREEEALFRLNLKRANDCLSELMGSLHMEQDLAKSIYSVYIFVSKRIGLANGSRQAEPLSDAVRLMKSLYETYKEDAKNDHSPAIMDRTQTVYAGLTYGKNSLTENREDGGSRGFLA